MILSEQAQHVLTEAKQRIMSLPPEERGEALKQLTIEIELLNRDLERTFSILTSVSSATDTDSIVQKTREAERHLIDYI